MAEDQKQQQPYFQLDPGMFKTGNFLIDGFVKKVVHSLNAADFNRNKVPDIAEAAMFGAKVLPLLVALDQAIDFEKAAESLASHPAIKDKQLFSETLKQLGALAEDAAKLIPHQD